MSGMSDVSAGGDDSASVESAEVPSGRPTANQAVRQAAREAANQAADQLERPDYLPISFLNALVYCPRRFYYEYAWGEMLVNEHVLQGRLQHKRADTGGASVTADALKVRHVYVYSDRLRIAGLLDVLEMPLDREDETSPGPDARPNGERGGLYPVEFKKGSPRGGGDNDRVQLCAQGLCLEERTGVSVAGGYVFSFGTMHRTWVAFTPELRALTEETIARAFALLREGRLPAPLPAEQDRKCRACSLEPLCMPAEVRALTMTRADRPPPRSR